MCPPPAPEAPTLSLGFSTCTVRPPGGLLVRGRLGPGDTCPPISPQEATGPGFRPFRTKEDQAPHRGSPGLLPTRHHSSPSFLGGIVPADLWARSQRPVLLPAGAASVSPLQGGPLGPRDHAHTLPVHTGPCHHLPSSTAHQPPLHGGGTGALDSQATRPRSREFSEIPESEPRPRQPPTPTRPLSPIPPSRVDELLSNKTKTLKAWHHPLQSQVPWETQRGRQGLGHPAPPPGDPPQSPSSYPVLWEGNSATATQGASLRGWLG